MVRVAVVPPVSGGDASSTVPRHVLIYSMRDNSTVFGGPPVEHSIGLELDAPTEESASPGGLRRRRSNSSPSRRGSTRPHPDTDEPCPLPAMADFYRIHDGFGVVVNTSDLPEVLEYPGYQAKSGSTYYVLPVRALGPVSETRPDLYVFGRIDKACVVAADITKEEPKVVYVERFSLSHVEEEETVIEFTVDTILNLVGASSHGYGY